MNTVKRRFTQIARRFTQMKNSKGSLTIEYAILIAIVIAALLGMQGYVKRAICGRWREAADTIGFGRQYEYGVTQ